MTKIYLFDWGNTLMVDFPDQKGKMCDWVKVQAVDGALRTLQELSKSHRVYIATNAADSSEADIKLSFDRVGLSPYISGYFCKANLGIGKGTSEFFHKIINVLNVEPQSIIMVGDTYEKDIEPAISVGIEAIWFNSKCTNHSVSKGVKQINHLLELCT
ncbi:HAD family hydrolase [Vibrio gallaecicus]|uniref:HAD family hydrolase n=1 Tax=Vibrio gallaecicus TaxID=552386 RepID=UPI0010C9AE61|nr:HAD family hydrolase [Vibrio gallaecicus]MDN3617285.1 HAD family hydrolase [Vibrio gallaecicus]